MIDFLAGLGTAVVIIVLWFWDIAQAISLSAREDDDRT